MSESKPQAPLMIGVSGLRGIVGESLTPEVAMRFAGVFGEGLWAVSPSDSTVVVARDGRYGGEGVYHAAICGLLSTGCDVIPIGVVMTPTLAVAVDETSSKAGLMVTASHNPAEWNGLKLLLTDEIEWPDPDDDPDHELTRRLMSTDWAAAPTAADAAGIIEAFRKHDPHLQDSIRVGRTCSFRSAVFDDPIGEHTHKVWSGVVIGFAHEYDDQHRDRPLDGQQDLGRNSKKWRVVLDSVNASGGPAAERLIHSFHAEAIQLHGDNSGIFPHTPEPTAENLSGEGGLCDAVPGLKADVGFAQDPDGDRLAIVDETGRYIGEEYTLALCAVSILEARKAAGDPFDDVMLCANLSTSRMVDDIAATYGASVVRTAVGEANVVEAMKRLKREGKAVLLGGEGNGGVIWPEVTYVRDSLGSMALVLSLMARTGKTVSELVADIPSYAIVKRKQPLARKEDAKPAIDRIAAAYATERVDTQDGVRVDFDSKRAWVHVRASNTEPILRLIAEAEDEAVANEILDDVAKLVEG
ncbi:MAG: phosphoglucosamine mutase [Planctomycetota bacterium]